MIGKLSLQRFLLLVFIGLVILLGFTTSARADLAVSEAGLNPAGEAYEINLDDTGWLWVTDATAGEVWGIDPTSGSYQVYPMGGFPVDARQADGWLWWADGFSSTLGRISTSDGSFTQWQIPYTDGFNGTNLDSQGRFYATDPFFPFLYRLDPNASQVCTFTLSSSGINYYIARDGDYLWLGDSINFRLYRLKVSDNSLTWWQLPTNSSPFGMAVDGQGNLWYADDSLSALVQLNPNTNQLTSYTLPIGYYPQMVAVQSHLIWYTEESLGTATIGRLDPLTADHTILSLTPNPKQLTPSCTDISPSSSGSITIDTGELSWADTSYPTLQNADGWQIYEMPDFSIPWGITVPGMGYMVDADHQKLIRFNAPFPPTLDVIKHVINDNGGTAVAGNFTMTVDAPGATPATFPGAESPGTEVIINPGAYSISETGPSGYTVSYSADCTGTLANNQTKICTVTNDDIPPANHPVFLPFIAR